MVYVEEMNVFICIIFALINELFAALCCVWFVVSRDFRINCGFEMLPTKAENHKKT